MGKIKDVCDFFKATSKEQQKQAYEMVCHHACLDDDSWICPDCGTENEQDYCEICGLKYLERRI